MELNNSYSKDIRKYTLKDFNHGNLQKVNYSKFGKICNNNGKNCLVYSLMDGNVIKIPKKLSSWGGYNFDSQLKEFENQLIALHKGIKTAEVFGNFYSHELETEENSFGLVMRDLGRITLDAIKKESDKKEAFKLWNLERKKLSKFGFREWDDYKETNAIWVPEERQTYLIDWGCNKYLRSDRKEILNEIYEEARIKI